MNRRQELPAAFWRIYLPITVAIALLLVWEALARLGLVSRIFFPAPTRIFGWIGRATSGGVLLPAIGATLGRMALGFVLGVLPALLLGWAMGRRRKVRDFFDPFIAAFHPIPKIAIFPLLMLIFGIGEASKVVAIAITSFFPVAINTLAGTRQISPVYFEVARNYGASRWQSLRRVVLPGSLPMVLAGVRIALNTSLVVAVAVELLASRIGLGVLIWFAWQTLRVEQMYGTLFVTAALGVALNVMVELLARRLAPWHRPGSPSGG